MKRFKSFRRCTFSHGVVDAKVKRVWNELIRIPRGSSDNCDLNSPQLALETIDRLVTVSQQTCFSQMYCSSISIIVSRKSTSASKFLFAVTQQSEIKTLSNCELRMRYLTVALSYIKIPFKSRFRFKCLEYCLPMQISLHAGWTAGKATRSNKSTSAS